MLRCQISEIIERLRSESDVPFICITKIGFFEKAQLKTGYIFVNKYYSKLPFQLEHHITQSHAAASYTYPFKSISLISCLP